MFKSILSYELVEGETYDIEIINNEYEEYQRDYEYEIKGKYVYLRQLNQYVGLLQKEVDYYQFYNATTKRTINIFENDGSITDDAGRYYLICDSFGKPYEISESSYSIDELNNYYAPVDILKINIYKPIHAKRARK